MACFLIDYENQKGSVLNGISLFNLNSNDEIIFFYAKRNTSIPMQLHKELESMQARKLYIDVETGNKNALDFQLVSYLGACIQKHPEKKYYIVSKDHDFDCVCHFWKNKNIYVQRINHIFDLCG